MHFFFNRYRIIITLCLLAVHGPLLSEAANFHSQQEEAIKQKGGVILKLALKCDEIEGLDLTKYSFMEKHNRLALHAATAGLGAWFADFALSWLLESSLEGSMPDQTTTDFLSAKSFFTGLTAACFAVVTQKNSMQDTRVAYFQDYQYGKAIGIGSPYPLLEPSTKTLKTVWGQIAIAELFSLLNQVAYHYVAENSPSKSMTRVTQELSLGIHLIFMCANLLANIPLWIELSKKTAFTWTEKQQILKLIEKSIGEQLQEQEIPFSLTTVIS